MYSPRGGAIENFEAQTEAEIGFSYKKRGNWLLTVSTFGLTDWELDLCGHADVQGSVLIHTCSCFPANLHRLRVRVVENECLWNIAFVRAESQRSRVVAILSSDIRYKKG
jgi:hypothetical protein